ncbi:MAG: hypothetical protein HY901_13090 [Deltaproteobacteria bacterium]|nr:hypothetical protein [Deltaproteobacteria bacterium]
MKAHEVPADEGFLEGYQRGAYAVDEKGQYRIVATSGWHAETAATAAALEEQDRAIQAAFEQVRAGRRSPLAYHIARRLLTPSLLASYAGVSRLRVAGHLRPFGFRRTPLWLAQRYAECLQMSLNDLVRLPEKPESLL